MIMFLTATDIGAVIAARVVQGLATGAFSAALVALAPPTRKKLGTVMGSVGVAGGLGVGALLAGLAIEYAPQPNAFVFTTLSVVTVFGVVATALAQESGSRRHGAFLSLVPRIRVPGPVRGEFAGAAPAVAAGWMLAALSLGVAPSIVRHAFHIAALYILAYAAFSIPAILAGLLVPTFGLVPTVAAYGTATFLLGVISLIRQLGIRAADRRSIPQRYMEAALDADVAEASIFSRSMNRPFVASLIQASRRQLPQRAWVIWMVSWARW
jgi:MFS family permease